MTIVLYLIYGDLLDRWIAYLEVSSPKKHRLPAECRVPGAPNSFWRLVLLLFHLAFPYLIGGFYLKQLSYSSLGRSSSHFYAWKDNKLETTSMISPWYDMEIDHHGLCFPMISPCEMAKSTADRNDTGCQIESPLTVSIREKTSLSLFYPD